MRVLRWLGVGIGVIVLAIAAVVVGARFGDGPIGMLPGGPFRSGEFVEARDVDFGFATDIDEVELESAGRSRTLWILVLGSQAYVPVSLDFPPGKTWHHEALEDPTAVLRVNGKRYRRKLVRVDDEGMRQRIGEVAFAKYGPGPAKGDLARYWFFHLAPPG